MSDKQEEALRELAELIERLNDVLAAEVEVPVELQHKEEE